MCTTTSTKSSSTQRPSRSPSRRGGLAPAARIFSSTASTIAPTCRSLAPVTITNTSVIASLSETSTSRMSLASLSAAAWAATRASVKAVSVAVIFLPASMRDQKSNGTCAANRAGRRPAESEVSMRSRISLIQAVFGDVLDDTVGHQVPHRGPAADPCPAVGRGDRERRDLDDLHRHTGKLQIVQGVTGSGDTNEMRLREYLANVLPGHDRGQRVGTGDEEPFGIGLGGAQVGQGVLGIRRPRSVDVHPGHGKA